MEDYNSCGMYVFARILLAIHQWRHTAGPSCRPPPATAPPLSPIRVAGLQLPGIGIAGCRPALNHHSMPSTASPLFLSA